MSGSSYVEQELGPERVGYFSQLPYLTLHGLNGEPDSIHRGVSLNLDVLCAPLGPPAAVLPPVPRARARVKPTANASHTDGGCGSACHNELINPLGFAFEHFDGMGQYPRPGKRRTDHRQQRLLPVHRRQESFADNAAELMHAMADESSRRTSATRKSWQASALQRDIVAEDLPRLELAAVSQRTQGSVKQAS